MQHDQIGYCIHNIPLTNCELRIFKNSLLFRAFGPETSLFATYMYILAAYFSLCCMRAETIPFGMHSDLFLSKWTMSCFNDFLGAAYKNSIYHLLSTPRQFTIAPEGLYERSWTGPMLFSMDCSTLLYPSTSISFDIKLCLRLAHIVC